MAAAMVDVMSGQIQLSFPSMTSVLSQVKAGKVKASAITISKRSALAPSILTMSEAGVPGYEASWNVILAPAGTPRPIVTRLHDVIVQTLRTPQAAERYANVDAEIRTSTPKELYALSRSDIAKWAKVIKAANIWMDQQ